MKNLISLLVIFFFTSVGAGKINFCYYPEYAYYSVKPANVKTEYCTHVGYSFFALQPDGTCYLLLPEEDNIVKELITKKSATTKICPVIGGNNRSQNFGAVASNPAARQKLVQTCGALMKKYGFDNCFDVDWEFPLSNERDAFIALLKDIKAGMTGVQLFTAVSAGAWQADISYNIPGIAATVDYINLMTYDYHGGWESTTGMNSALSGPPGDGLNIQASVNYYKSKGAPANKLLIGVPFYERSYTLTTASNTVGSPSIGGDAVFYKNFCTDKSFSIVRDPIYQAAYAVNGNTWVSIEDPTSIAAKTKFVLDNGLAGIIIWSLEQDDASGACGAGSWPLLTAVYNGLNGGGSPNPGSRPVPPKPEPAPEPVPVPAPGPGPRPGGSFRCPASASGYFVDAQDCGAYHYCSGGLDMGLQRCPPGLKFVPLGNGDYTCDYTSPVC